MICKNCGNDINEELEKCESCGASYSDTVDEKSHPLEGKEYFFVSSRGVRFGFITQIANNIKVSDDRLFIETSPNKCNQSPSILLEDIMGITIKTKFALLFIIAALFCLLGGIVSGGIMLIFVPILLWIGYNKKIIISLRNGKNIVIYSNSKKIAEEFKSDMKLITKIQ